MKCNFEKPVPGAQIAGLARRKVSREKNSGGGGKGVSFFSSYLFFLSFFICFVLFFFSPLSFSRHTLYLHLNAWNRFNLECKISIAPTQQRQTVKWCWILVLRKLLLVQLNTRKGGLVPLPLVLKTVTLSSCDKRGVHLSEGKNGSYVAGTKV